MNNILCFDLETKCPGVLGGGLMPWHKDARISIASWAFIRDKKPVVMAEGNPKMSGASSLESYIQKADTLAGWNLQFDVAWLLAKGFDRDLLMSKNYIDGLLLWKRVDKMDKAFRKEELKEMWKNDLSYSLKQAVREMLPQHADYEEGIDFEKSDIIELMEYAKKDAKFTLQIIYKLLKQLPDNERFMFEQDCNSIPLVADSWQRGIPISKPHLQTLQSYVTKEAAAVASELGIDASLVRSHKKFKEFLFVEHDIMPPKDERMSQRYKMFVPRLTDGGKAKFESRDPTLRGQWDYTMCSTDELSLLRIADDSHEIGAKLAKLKSLDTKATKFAKGVKESCIFNGKGVTYPGPRLAGTYTGRMTYQSKTTLKDEKGINRQLKTGVALHQWQQDPMVRNLFKTPDDMLLVELDAAGQEMRLMADYSGDETMLRLFNEGMDLHSFMGAKIADRDYDEFVAMKNTDADTKTQRKLGKLANLSLQYRTSNYTLADKARERPYYMHLTVAECDSIMSKYFDAYPGVKEYWAKAIKAAEDTGCAETRGGRKVWLGTAGGKDSWRKSSAAINFPIQGTGADMKSYALAVLRDYCHKNSVLFAWDLHDGLFFYVPASEGHDIALEMRSILGNLDYSRWGWQPKLPLPWDASIGPRWGELEEMK